jgi:ketosteroid isomerase-like protein
MSSEHAAAGGSDTTAWVTRLYDLEMNKDLDPWMDMWDESFVITFPFATDPAMTPIRGKDKLREITRQKFIDRVRIELSIRVMPLADPLKALAYLDVAHTLADGTVRRLPLLCLFTFNAAGRIVALEEFFNEAAVG